jgi:hypothetical protein
MKTGSCTFYGGQTNGGGGGGYGSGGGGAGESQGGSANGGSGANGVVIISWPDTYSTATANIGGAYSHPTGYHVYKFTSSGSITI